jgi:hypothetical protein
MSIDDELDGLVDRAARGASLDAQYHSAGCTGRRLIDALWALAAGPPPAPSPELAQLLAGERIANQELSPGAARAVRLAQRCLPNSPRRRRARRQALGA